MHGFDRQLAGYLRLYSRIGFAQLHQPGDPDNKPTVLAQDWDQLGLRFGLVDSDHADNANAELTSPAATSASHRSTDDQITRVQPAGEHRDAV